MHHVWNCRTQATTHKRLEKRERERARVNGGNVIFDMRDEQTQITHPNTLSRKNVWSQTQRLTQQDKKTEDKRALTPALQLFYWSPISDICMLAEQTTRCISKCTNINAATKKHNLLPHSASYQISPKICTTKFKNTIWKKATVTASSSWNQRKELR